MSDLIKILDTLEDISEQGDDLIKAVKRQSNAPVVHVEAPSVRIEAPDIKIPPTVVNVAASKPPEPTSWEFVITERDINNLIKKFTATPIKK